MLNLTRRNIIYDDLDRDTFGNDWFRINAPHDTDELIEANRNALLNFLQARAELFNQDEGHPNRTEEQKHLVARITIKNVWSICLTIFVIQEKVILQHTQALENFKRIY